MKNIVPIFPLNLVMFPDAIYPLHIFEERYKRMIRRCLENNEHFGIVSKIEFDIAKLGCLVKVTRVIETYENGSMDIIVRGDKRFITENTNMHNDGYLEAEIIIFNDSEMISDSDYRIFEETVRTFKNIIKKTSLTLSSVFWQNLYKSENKSFKLAEKSGLNLRQQQDILSLQSEKERLNYLHDHLEKLDKTLDRSEALKDIILADGYLNEL